MTTPASPGPASPPPVLQPIDEELLALGAILVEERVLRRIVMRKR